MTDIVVEVPTVEVTNNTYVEVSNGAVSTELTKASDIEVLGSKQEYSIVGDALYASISADSAPDWLTSIIDSTVATGLNAGLQDLQSANASLVAAVGEMEVAKNEYQQLINIDASVDASVVSHLGTLNATVDQNSASIVTLDANKVTATEATAIALSQISAELGTTGGIGAEVTRIDSAIASLDQAYSTSIDTLTATYQSTNTDLAATSTLVNTVQADLEGVRAQFAYNVNAQIGGQYYTSGFGLDTSGTYGGTGTELDPFTSEFWINAKEFVVKDGATEYIRWNGTVLEVSGDIVGANITGSTVTGGLVRTATSGKRVELDSVSNTVLSYDNAGNTITSLGLANTEVEGAFLDTFLTIDTTYDVVRTIGAFVKTNDIGIMVRGEADATAIRGIDCKVVNYVETSGYNSIGSTSKSRNISLGLCVGSSITAEQYGTGNSMVYGTLCTALAGSLSGGTKTVYGGYFAGNTIGGTLGTSYGIYSIGGTYDFYAAGIGASYGPFTGAHDGLVKIGSNYTPGDIIQDGKHIASKGVSDTIFTSILSVSCNTPAIGVVVGAESFMIPAALSIKKELTNEQIEDGAEPEELGILPDGYSVIQFNALGEGQINICGEGGDLANGDLIVTSSTPGKGMKQADNIVRNYTVAKVRGDWSFSLPDEIKQVPCIYLCG